MRCRAFTIQGYEARVCWVTTTRPVLSRLKPRDEEWSQRCHSLAACVRRRNQRPALIPTAPTARHRPAKSTPLLQGYAPQAIVAADEVPAGRPSPFMAWAALTVLNVQQPWAAVKVRTASCALPAHSPVQPPAHFCTFH